MNSNYYVAIMAGGVGSRFWPASREARPKQFLDILGIGKTLLQMTYERFLPLIPKENIFVVTNKKYVNLYCYPAIAYQVRLSGNMQL